MIYPKLKALLDLGRVSNLPSIVTNVVAAWILARGEIGFGVVPTLLAAVLFYLGGTTLNDAVDARFDRENRSERPIPSGIFSVAEVWLIGGSYLLVGGLIFLFLTAAWPGWVVALAFAILLYDVVHKKWQGAVFVMGSCRLFLYLVVASAAAGEIWAGPLVLTWAAALFLYIVGLTFVARGESTGGGVSRLAIALLAAPVVAACFSLVDGGWNIVSGMCLLAFLAWVGACFLRLRGDDPARVGRFVGGLLAGIPLIDALAVSTLIPWLGVALLLALPVSLASQRLVAAT